MKLWIRINVDSYYENEHIVKSSKERKDFVPGEVPTSSIKANPYPPAGGPQASSADLRSIFGPPLRHWKLTVIITLFSLLMGYGVLRMVPSLYKSTVEVLIFDPQR